MAAAKSLLCLLRFSVANPINYDSNDASQQCLSDSLLQSNVKISTVLGDEITQDAETSVDKETKFQQLAQLDGNRLHADEALLEVGTDRFEEHEEGADQPWWGDGRRRTNHVPVKYPEDLDCYNVFRRYGENNEEFINGFDYLMTFVDGFTEYLRYTWIETADIQSYSRHDILTTYRGLQIHWESVVPVIKMWQERLMGHHDNKALEVKSDSWLACSILKDFRGSFLLGVQQKIFAPQWAAVRRCLSDLKLRQHITGYHDNRGIILAAIGKTFDEITAGVAGASSLESLQKLIRGDWLLNIFTNLLATKLSAVGLRPYSSDGESRGRHGFDSLIFGVRFLYEELAHCEQQRGWKGVRDLMCSIPHDERFQRFSSFHDEQRQYCTAYDELKLKIREYADNQKEEVRTGALEALTLPELQLIFDIVEKHPGAQKVNVLVEYSIEKLHAFLKALEKNFQK